MEVTDIMGNILGNILGIHKGPDVQVDTDALGNIIDKSPGDTLDVYKSLSSETKMTYFNHQNMEKVHAEVDALGNILKGPDVTNDQGTLDVIDFNDIFSIHKGLEAHVDTEDALGNIPDVPGDTTIRY